MSTTGMMPDDRRTLALRLSVLQVVIAAAFGGLAVGFWVFQIVQHEEFKYRAQNNHLRSLALRAPRGVVLDRHGEVLVSNRVTFNISLVREQVKDLDRTLAILAQATGVEESALHERVERFRREPPYRPIVLIPNAGDELRIAVSARALELPGVIAEEMPTRRYPTDAIAAHLFGYVTEVREEQLQRPEFEGIGPGAIVGQAGIEAIYNQLLMGEEGRREVIVNSIGREIDVLGTDDPVEGRGLQLTIDADVQRALEDAFRHAGYNGAAVILQPQTGEVLSLVSLPAYDPNEFATGISRAGWAALNSDTLKPLSNRALQGRFSPGSTFKIVVAVAALEEGVSTPERRIFCPGSATFFGRAFRCHKVGGHGSLDLRQAIAQSCNVYFYTLGNMLGVDRLHKWAAALGLADRTGIDLPNEVQSIMPSTEWKLRTTGQRWFPGETISVAIGQGQVTTTPMAQAVMMMTLGNSGTRHTPHLLKAVDHGRGLEPIPLPEPRSVVRFKDTTLKAVYDGLWMAVHGGTARRAMVPGRDVAGKTGTAQVISLGGAAAMKDKMDVRHHGWFVFFAPRDNPEIAGVILAEHAGGSGHSLPIARHAIETYFAKKEGLPLPVLQPAPGTPIAAPAATVPAAVATGEAPAAAPRPSGGTE
jgi:penicillin-binding protein 2